MSRMPVRRLSSASERSAATPSPPASAKPLEMMRQQPTPASAHSRTVAGTEAAGIATIATSTGGAASMRA